MTSRDKHDAFYVGYQPRAASASAHWVQRACLSVTVLAGLAIGLFVGEYAGRHVRVSGTLFLRTSSPPELL